MREAARRYREEVYRLRSHPREVDLSIGVDHRDSFVYVYVSIFPFLVGEYCAEAMLSETPAGLVFPVGYLLFWAFFYTYYRPNGLEDRLARPDSWSLLTVPSLLLGVSVWFVKVTIVEFVELAIFQGLLGKGLFSRRAKSTPPPPRPSLHQQQFKSSAKSHPPQRPELPHEIRMALRSLGLSDGCRDWTLVHRRYRELAKRYHPDLNQDITAAGNRFIEIDKAYRKLEIFKARFFGS